MRIWGGLGVRPRRREVSLLLTGIKQTRWKEGVSGAEAGGRARPGAVGRSPPGEGQAGPADSVTSRWRCSCWRLSSTPASCHPTWVQAPGGHPTGLLPLGSVPSSLQGERGYPSPSMSSFRREVVPIAPSAGARPSQEAGCI